MARNKVSKNDNEMKYPTISKCSISRCKACPMLICRYNIRSYVNNRVFNISISSNLDCCSQDIIYVLT